MAAMPVTTFFRRWKMFLVAAAALLLAGVVIVTVIAERESAYTLQAMGGTGELKALILYHPSRDAHFTDDLSTALAYGLTEAAFTVDRATLTRQTPGTPSGYALVLVVSNTFYWTPDLPTLRYLKRARLEGIATVGIIAGGGATTRSQQVLERYLLNSGARVIAMRSFWIARPNDASRMSEPNRVVALDLARTLGVSVGKTVAAARAPETGP
jgi:hypothetical protein